MFHANCLHCRNLHEMSNPVFWENVNLFSAELAQRVLQVKVQSISVHLVCWIEYGNCKVSNFHFSGGVHVL